MARKSTKAAGLENARLQVAQLEDARFETNRWAFFVEATAKAFQYKDVMLNLGLGEAPFEVRNVDGRFVLNLESPAAAGAWKVHFDSSMWRGDFMASLNELESELSMMENDLAEQKSREAARRGALAKLTAEERELLGLPKF